MFASCPEFFRKLNRDALTIDGRKFVEGLGMEIAENKEGKEYVKHLSSAASKWRLADLTEGLMAKIKNEETLMAYSGQLQVTLSVISYEAYCRVYGKMWYTFKGIEWDKDFCEDAELVREKLQGSSLNRLIKTVGTNNKTLIGRLEKFKEKKDNSELVAIAIAVRHAFSHGKIGADIGISQSAKILKKVMLQSVEKHCEKIVSKISNAE